MVVKSGVTKIVYFLTKIIVEVFEVWFLLEVKQILISAGFHHVWDLHAFTGKDMHYTIVFSYTTIAVIISACYCKSKTICPLLKICLEELRQKKTYRDK